MRVEAEKDLTPKQRAIRAWLKDMDTYIDEWARVQSESAYRNRKKIVAALKEAAARAVEEKAPNGGADAA